MVVLDSTIVNIALPSAQADLGFSTGNRQWVVTAYALAFGSLLLVGGKLGDLFGRKWTFIGGLIGFSIASVHRRARALLRRTRGRPGTAGRLRRAARPLGAVAADGHLRGFARSVPRRSASSRRSRPRALRWDYCSAAALTDALSWRWCLYVNLVIAIPAAILALRLIVNERPEHAAATSTSSAWRSPAADCSRSSSASPRPSPTRGRPPVDDRLARRGRRAARRLRRSPSGASPIRCCRCTSCGTAPAVARTPRS